MFYAAFCLPFWEQRTFFLLPKLRIVKSVDEPPLKNEKVVIMSSFPMMPCFNTLCICPCCLDFLLHHIHHSLIPSRFCSLQGIIYTRKMNKLTSLLFYFILTRPGVGKTTVIREIARVLADELHKRVVCITMT